jgi:hypothetical protein
VISALAIDSSRITEKIGSYAIPSGVAHLLTRQLRPQTLPAPKAWSSGDTRSFKSPSFSGWELGSAFVSNEKLLGPKNKQQAGENLFGQDFFCAKTGCFLVSHPI